MAPSPMAEIAQLAIAPQRAPRVCPPLGIINWGDFVLYRWSQRRCWICERYGHCRHREPEAESELEFKAIKAAYRRSA